MNFKYAWTITIATLWPVFCLALLIAEPIIGKNILPQDVLAQFFIVTGPLLAMFALTILGIIICELLAFFSHFAAAWAISPYGLVKTLRIQLAIWRLCRAAILRQIEEERHRRCQNTTRE